MGKAIVSYRHRRRFRDLVLWASTLCGREGRYPPLGPTSWMRLRVVARKFITIIIVILVVYAAQHGH